VSADTLAVVGLEKLADLGRECAALVNQARRELFAIKSVNQRLRQVCALPQRHVQRAATTSQISDHLGRLHTGSIADIPVWAENHAYLVLHAYGIDVCGELAYSWVSVVLRPTDVVRLSANVLCRL